MIGYRFALRLLAICTLLSSWCLAQGYGNGYQYRQAIVLDHTKVANTDQTDFPVLISGVFVNLKSVGSGGEVQSSAGYDIVFASDPQGANQLDHEIDSYDPITGTASFWVRVPTLSHAADTVLYMFHGKASVSTSQENKTGVWRNGYAAVYHFAPSGMGADSTGTNNGTAQQVSAASGQIATAAGLSGQPTSFVQIPSNASFKPTAAMTVEAWVKPASWGNNNAIASVDYRADGSWSPPFVTWALTLSGSSSQVEFVSTVNGAYSLVTSQTALSANQWQMVAGRYDGQQLQVLINGAAEPNSTPLTGNLDPGTSRDLSIGQISSYWAGAQLT